MPAPFDVVVLGGYCLDLIFTGLPGFPQLGAEVVSAGFHLAPGGAFISVAAMRRLALHVGWAADFGDDDFSRFVLARAQAEGLDPALFLSHPGPLRNITVALSYPHDRAFVGYYDPEPAAPAAVAAAREAATRVLYLAHFHRDGPVLEAALERASTQGLSLLMDGNTSDHSLRLDQPGARRALASLKAFLPNATEARRLTDQANLTEALRVLADACPLVVVKDGASGAYACDGGRIIHEPAIRVQPVDTTGAGDCFSAGFVKAWLDGLPLDQCLRWGNVVGGLSTLAPGGAGRVVSADEVREWL